MPVNNNSQKNPLNRPPTKEFVVKGGDDSTLWGDIDSDADKAWSNQVWLDMVTRSKQADTTTKAATSQSLARSLVASRIDEAKRLAETVIKPSEEEDETAVATKHLAGRHNQKNHGNRGGVPAKGSDKYNAQQELSKPKKINEIRKNIRNISESSSEKIDKHMKGFGNGSISGLDIIDNAYSYTDEETGISSVVDGVFLDTDLGDVEITGVLVDSDGEEVGQFRRQLMGDGKSVYHNEFKVDKGRQANGFGRRFYENQESAYKEAGFDKILLQADRGVGGYAWARMGFDFDSPSMAQQFGENFSTFYKRNYGDYPSPFPKHSWEIAAYKDPSGYSVGKEFMLGSNWEGVKKLSPDSLGYQIGQDYYASK